MSRYKINIMEHQYYINTDRDPAWVKMIQERLNGQIEEIREGCPNISAFDLFYTIKESTTMMTMTAEQIRLAMENKLEYLMEVKPQSASDEQLYKVSASVNCSTSPRLYRLFFRLLPIRNSIER